MISTKKDVDECSEELDNCEQVCINTVGSFECSCLNGFELATNGFSCDSKCRSHAIMQLKVISLSHESFTDIIECRENNGNCTQICTDTIGSFVCSCNDGYVLDINRLSCNGKLMELYVTLHIMLSENKMLSLQQMTMNVLRVMEGVDKSVPTLSVALSAAAILDIS